MRVSICVPYHSTPQTAFFLERMMKSIKEQTFTDYEIVLTNNRESFGANHNQAFLESKGEIIKMLQMDDYFAHPEALQRIVDAFTDDTKWLISANLHDKDGVLGYPHIPTWDDQIWAGRNTLGSASTIAVRQGQCLFDDSLQWLIDCDWYWRMFLNYGAPTFCLDPGVVVSWHENQMTNKIPQEIKDKEFHMMIERYGK